jgi:2,4-diaminopentanoate dehydrogenase
MNIAPNDEPKPPTRVNQSAPVNVLHVGLGPIGLAAMRLSATRSGLRLVGAVDVDPKLSGADVGDQIGNAAIKGLKISDRIPRAVDGERNVAIHATSSSVERCQQQLIELAEKGWFVVSSCEELSYPWINAPGAASDIDRAARAGGVVIVGTGVNPGYAMDYLPIALSATMRRVDSVRVLRVQDAGQRRLPLQKKVGAGLSVEEFEQRVQMGTVRHVGLLESAQTVVVALGLAVTDYSDVIEPIIATEPTPSALGLIKPGHVLGVRQVCEATVNSKNVVRLELQMAVGLNNARDDIALLGDPPISVSVAGGFHGDTATQAILINTIGPAFRAAAGLRTMEELCPPRPSV